MIQLEAAPPLVNVIAEALREPRRDKQERLVGWSKETMEAGWTRLTALVDQLELQDRRLYPVLMLIEELCALYELPVRWCGRRPTNRHSKVSYSRCLAAADAAALMANLRHLGFAVDPTELIELLQPTLVGKSILSDAEAEIAFFGANRERMRTRLIADGSSTFDRTQRRKDTAGYTVSWDMLGEDVSRLTIRGPRFRPRKERETVTCEYCGASHTPGDIDSAREHRRHHRRRENTHDPKPLKQLAKLMKLVPDWCVVNQSSPRWLHKEVYERAMAFKREMHFDFPQWLAPPSRGPIEEDGVAHLMTRPDAPATILGVCAFRLRDDGWTLDWAWVAPKFRRAGLLRENWPRFTEAYGDFPLEHPLSPEMTEFVRKFGTKAQKQRLQERTSTDVR